MESSKTRAVSLHAHFVHASPLHPSCPGTAELSFGLHYPDVDDQFFVKGGKLMNTRHRCACSVEMPTFLLHEP